MVDQAMTVRSQLHGLTKTFPKPRVERVLSHQRHNTWRGELYHASAGAGTNKAQA